MSYVRDGLMTLVCSVGKRIWKLNVDNDDRTKRVESLAVALSRSLAVADLIDVIGQRNR